MIEIRDILAGRHEILFDEKLTPPKFNGTRLQLYPIGGGFLSAHRDTTAQKNLEKNDHKNYIQLVLLMTERNLHYKSGGAYVFNEKNEYIDTELNSHSGDILIYDGSTTHGVMDIDPQLPLSRSSLSGRLVAMATIYS